MACTIRRLALSRIERFDPYSNTNETDRLFLLGGSGTTATTESYGRYDVEGEKGLESTLARSFVEVLETVERGNEGDDTGSADAAWEYFPARAMCGDDTITAGLSSDMVAEEGVCFSTGRVVPSRERGCVGPQDLEERIELKFTRPTDGLGFCAAWCFFLAECRVLNPDVPSAALVSRVVGQLARRPAEEWSELAQAAALETFSELNVARVYDAGRAYAADIVSSVPAPRYKLRSRVAIRAGFYNQSREQNCHRAYGQLAKSPIIGWLEKLTRVCVLSTCNDNRLHIGTP